jgi:glutamine amidotransferase
VRIAAAIRRGAWTGCQFHPEKSGPVGLRIIENFVESRKATS